MAVSICDVHTNTNEQEVTGHGRREFPIAIYEDDMRVVPVPLHWHEEYEYILATKGLVTVNLGTQQVELKEGEAVFINSGCLHGVKSISSGESVLRSLVILPRLIGGSTDSIFWSRLVAPLSGKTAPAWIFLDGREKWQQEIREQMLLAWEVIREEDFDYENEARFRVSRAIRLLLDNLPQIEVQGKRNDSVVNRMKPILAYMEAHYMEDISNQLLMELGGCSESVLLRNFRQVTGTSPLQYLLDYRMQKAAEMLLTTEIKSADIAMACGFRDVSYFTKTFRRKMGSTPIEYRKSKEEGHRLISRDDV